MGRPRKLSVQSDDEDARRALQGGDEITKVFKESEVIRPIAPYTDPNSLPVYLLMDAEASIGGTSTRDPKKIVDAIRHAKPGSNLKVVGTVMADDDFKHNLVLYSNGQCSYNKNKSRITLNAPKDFSVADGPPTFWIQSDGGHYEIQPSKDYRVVFQRIIVVIVIKFAIEDFYESYPEGGKALGMSMDDEIAGIFLRVMSVKIGTGITASSIYAACSESIDFLKNQMLQTATIKFEGSKAATEAYLKTNQTYRWMHETKCRILHPKAALPIDPLAREPSPSPPPVLPPAPKSRYVPQRRLSPDEHLDEMEVDPIPTTNLNLNLNFDPSLLSPSNRDMAYESMTLVERTNALLSRVTAIERMLDQ